jgi:hypothetical protein
MRNVQFEIKEVTSLAVDPNTGKFRLVTREPGYQPSGMAGAATPS